MPDITFQAIDGSKQKGLPDMSSPRQISRAAVAVAFAVVSLNCAALQAPADFVTTVTSTHPLAYYRLDAASGTSQVGTTTWKSTGGVTAAAPGAPIGASVSNFAKFDGLDGMITTTQMGGIGTAATIMAWVNLAVLPSKIRRILYVAGESQSGNDLDLQFEPDNALRFFTAGGGNLSYIPPVATLVNQWHLVVASVDTVSRARVMYWDGKQVATDKGGGRAGKTSRFTIGESPVFTGRFFKGGIEEVALWNRALKATEVAAIYAAGKSTASPADAGSPSASAGAIASGPGTGPFATTAKIEIEDAKGPVQLKRDEQIAYMFLSAIEIIEHECQLTLQHVCPMDQILSGSYPKGASIEHLKFDPSKADPNYTYTLATNGMAWEAHANPRKPGLKGFCSMARDIGTVVVTYSNTGPAGWTSTELGNRGMEGDSFATQ